MLRELSTVRAVVFPTHTLVPEVPDDDGLVLWRARWGLRTCHPIYLTGFQGQGFPRSSLSKYCSVKVLVPGSLVSVHHHNGRFSLQPIGALPINGALSPWQYTNRC